MSGTTRPTPTVWALWRRNLLVWVALLVLLGTTYFAAHLSLGVFNVIVGLCIASLKALLVAFLFMGLKRSSPLVRLAAMSGLYFLVILFMLTLSDYLTRPT